MEEIDLKELIKYFFSKVSIIICVTLLFFIVGVVFVKKDTVMYKSSSSVVLTKEVTTEITDDVELSINKYLTNTFVEIVGSKTVANEVIKDLNLDIKAEELVSNIEAAPVWESDIVEVSLKYTDKEKITKILNKIVDVSIREITDLYEINNIKVIEIATEPTTDSSISGISKVIIISSIGFILGFIIVFIMYCFSTTIKSEKDIEKSLGLSVLSKISYKRRKNNSLLDNEYDIKEEMKKVSIYLKNKYLKNKENVLIITSASPNEGKTFVATNLSATFSKLGLKVLLIDFNLKAETLSNIFNVESKKSLLDLLSDDIKNYKKYINNTKINNLSVLSSRFNNSNSWEVLNSDNIKELIDLLKEEYDLIIFDCPSMSESATALSLTEYASVAILTCLYKKTSINKFDACKKELQNTNIEIAGVVVNK